MGKGKGKWPKTGGNPRKGMGKPSSQKGGARGGKTPKK